MKKGQTLEEDAKVFNEHCVIETFDQDLDEEIPQQHKDVGEKADPEGHSS